MVEEMYQQEAKEETDQATTSTQRDDDQHQNNQITSQSHSPSALLQPETNTLPETLADATAMQPGSSHVDPTNIPIIDATDLYGDYGPAAAASGLGPAARMRLGAAGDVSLTLGLRHAGNAPDKNRPYSIRDFGGC